jgi:hypothetical protein
MLPYPPALFPFVSARPPHHPLLPAHHHTASYILQAALVFFVYQQRYVPAYFAGARMLMDRVTDDTTGFAPAPSSISCADIVPPTDIGGH